VKFGLKCYDRDENRTGNHSGSIQLFRGFFFLKALGNVNDNHLKIPKNHRGPHRSGPRRVFETPALAVGDSFKTFA